MKIAVVGAGIFGCSIALELDKPGYNVTLYEKENDILLGATRNNHNRLHYGYHYPRSLETTKQSLDGLISFLAYYGGCAMFGFENYYAISNNNSKTTATEFKDFCTQAGIGFKIKKPFKKYINYSAIDECYLVEEPVYDWDILQSIIKCKIRSSDISVLLNTDFKKSTASYDFIFNCTYSCLEEICNHVGVKSSVEYKKQDVIIPIFTYKSKSIGLTIMDGQFCSIMPNGFNHNKFLLYHAKHSVMEEKLSGDLDKNSDINCSIIKIFSDSKNYFPFLSKAIPIGYYRSDRVIPINNNDERLSDIITYNGNDNFVTIFSGKVTTAVQIAKRVAHGIQTGDFTSNISVW